MDERLTAALSELTRDRSGRPIYRRLAEVLGSALADGEVELPPARALAVELGLNRATVTAAYRELARLGLVVLRRGRPGRKPEARPHREDPFAPPPGSALDLARYVPDKTLLPEGKVLRWLGFGDGEGESVAQYGDAHGYPPLREWVEERLAAWGVAAAAADIVLTSGVQHGLDLLLRALARPGDAILVEDPTYPGLPPLLAMHKLEAIGARVGEDGLVVDEVERHARGGRVRLAVLTPTLQNPSGTVMNQAARTAVMLALQRAGVTVIEELFDPGLVVKGRVPPPLAARDSSVISVGSFSKVLFPGLRVGWLAGPPEVTARVAAVKRATDLSGSTFLEATALSLCRRGQLEAQMGRLRSASRERWGIVREALVGAADGVRWSEPRGGFSAVLELPPGVSSRAVAARAAAAGVWVLSGPTMSVTGRDDVLRLAFAAVGGERLRRGVGAVLEAMSVPARALALV